MFRSLRLVPALLLACFGAAGTGNAQTADEIIARNLEARGGAQRLRSLESVKIAARVTAQGMELPVTSWAKRPNLIRRHTQFQNTRLVVAFDGMRVWGIDPTASPGEPQEISGPQAHMMREEAEFDSPFLDYRGKGHSVAFVATETINGRPAHHLKLEKKGGQVRHYYLDVETALEMRIVTTLEHDGMRAEIASDLSDYRTVEGLRVPFAMQQSMNGNPRAQVVLEKVEFNVPVADEFFRMPPGRTEVR